VLTAHFRLKFPRDTLLTQYLTAVTPRVLMTHCLIQTFFWRIFPVQGTPLPSQRWTPMSCTHTLAFFTDASIVDRNPPTALIDLVGPQESAAITSIYCSDDPTEGIARYGSFCHLNGSEG
ncbi:unnamed protein product, partial [Laminaria digitata]